MANGTIKIDKRRLSLLYPFHKEALFGAFGVNVLLGLLMTALPVYHTVQMLLSEPGDSAYFALHSH